MNFRLRRRQFAQLVFSSAATAAIANFASKTLAQSDTQALKLNKNQKLYGVRAGSKGFVLQSLNLTPTNLQTDQLQTAQSATKPIQTDDQPETDQVKNNQLQDQSALTQGLSLVDNERLAAFTVLADGTLAVATASLTADITGKPDKSKRLNLVQTSVQTLQSLSNLAGLDEYSTVEDWVETADGNLLSLVSLNQGALPVHLANINRTTAQVSYVADLDLPQNQRLRNLTQCPNGNIYATTIGPEGYPHLVQLALNQKSIITGKGQLIDLGLLTFNKKPLPTNLVSLASSASNQLYALADPTYAGTNSLFTLDVNTRVMNLLRTFDFDKIAFSKA